MIVMISLTIHFGINHVLINKTKNNDIHYKVVKIENV